MIGLPRLIQSTESNFLPVSVIVDSIVITALNRQAERAFRVRVVLRHGLVLSKVAHVPEKRTLKPNPGNGRLLNRCQCLVVGQ